ncbi:DNA methylase [Pseudomonas sp. PIC25]|nr:DNA methylase [Pseudomonas sp. PIC25]
MSMLDETLMQQPEPTVTGTALQPLALKDAPALIETVFPAQKVSFEAQKERKANLGQTLTGLGSYWKGRKPLILVRAIVLGSLLPPTDDAEADLAIFEKLMAFDDEGLARRALAANAFSAAKLQELIPISDPERYFGGRGWRRDITDDDKLVLYRQALATLPGYEEKAGISKRPEELDQDWLYAPVWAEVNCHYAHLGVNVQSLPELVEQFGILRYGHRPRVGDTFSGGGSIPFEAARIGCDVYASDLNPVACMLTWGALNIIGASPERRTEIAKAQERVAKAVDAEITKLGIEHDKQGNRAKSYLYCLEARCPETGWMIPLSPSWVISKGRNIVARLKPDHGNKRFDIEIVSGVSAKEAAAADQGTVREGDMVYTLDGKTYRTPIKTLRGDYRNADGSTGNRLRRWEKSDFKPRPDDIFQERLYAIHWIAKATLNKSRQETWFAAPTDADWERERRVETLVAENLSRWQDEGLVPDMAIETGDKTDELIRTRGWSHWHHLFNARQLLLISRYFQHRTPEDYVFNAKSLDWNSRIANWMNHWEKTNNVFYNQALNTFYNYGIRCFASHEAGRSFGFANGPLPNIRSQIKCLDATTLQDDSDVWITDPPYADAVNYHEITEFFIAWLRKNPPKPFDEWVWDSRRALAIKGSDDDFRRGMVGAYKAMADHMPDNGMQCVMFTHQDTGVWGDLIGIFWAAGLQVVAAWYIATETNAAIKKGSFVQGTVILMLKKRAAGERTGFKQRLLPAVRQEVASQIETMMHLNDTVKAHHGEPVFNDSDLQMAGYAAALKVLTAYTHIGGEDVTSFALRPRARGEVTVVDEIVQQAAETASGLLVPEGLTADTWAKLAGIERFVLRMLDMETTGAQKLDNYQNFAKAFRVEDYSRVMGDMRPNHARLKRVTEFASRDLTESTELGASRLGRLVMALQQRLKDVEAQAIIDQIRHEMADFLEVRPLLADMLAFIERKSSEDEVRTAAEVLGARLKNLRFGA